MHQRKKPSVAKINQQYNTIDVADLADKQYNSFTDTKADPDGDLVVTQAPS